MNYRRHSFSEFQESEPVPRKDPCDPRLLFKPDFRQSSVQSDADEANRKVEQARSQSYACGLEEGREEGCRMARSALAPCLSQFGSAYDDMAALIPALAETIAGQVIELTHGICDRILGKQMTLTKEDLENLHSKLIKKIAECQHLSIHFHPDDCAAIEDLAGSVSCQWPAGCDHLSLIKDANQVPGQLTLQMPDSSFGISHTGNAAEASVEDLAELIDAIPRLRTE